MPAAFITILLTSLSAFAGAPVWTTLIGASVLFAISYRKHRTFAVRFANVGVTNILAMTAWQSAGNAILASGAAYILGATMHLVAPL